MADEKDVTAEAAELNAAEEALKGLALERDEEHFFLSRFLGGLQVQLKENKVRYNLAIAMGNDKEKNAILDVTRGLLKQKASIEKQLGGTK